MNKIRKEKVLFICKKRVDEYGISYGLVNSATFVSKFLNWNYIESKVIVVQDGNCIDKEVMEYNPTHVILEALWVTPHKIEELLTLKRHKDRKFVIRLHSKIPFIANEGIAFEWISEYAKIMQKYDNLILAPNSEEFTDDLKQIYNVKNIVYLPNIYIKSYTKEQHLDPLYDSINIGCFGAIRPLKNTLIQAVAAIKYAEENELTLYFHINGNRQEQKGDQVYKNLKNLFEGCVDSEGQQKHFLIEHDWLCHDDFLQLIDKMDIGMQVSLSETFNIVVADFVSRNIPVVYSKEIDWLPLLNASDSNSSESIKDSIYFNYEFRKCGITYFNKWFLNRWNKKAYKKWLKFV